MIWNSRHVMLHIFVNVVIAWAIATVAVIDDSLPILRTYYFFDSDALVGYASWQQTQDEKKK